MTRQGSAKLHVVAFESRLAAAMRELILRHGGEPTIAPALREIPLAENHEALAFADQLLAGQVDLLICLTGVGTRTLVAAMETRQPRAVWQASLRRITIVARGPKPAAALRELELTFLTVPEPNTWRELLATLDARGTLAGQRVAVQEYGASNVELLTALRARGAQVTPVPVYRWALPHDLQPLRQAAQTVAEGGADLVLFTNATQVEHLHTIAEQEGVADRVAEAFQRLVVGSIGPISSEALRRHGYPVDLEPSHPKMGILVKEALAQAPMLLRAKRA